MIPRTDEAGENPSGGRRAVNDVPFFVIGSSRSGTTMFRLMLNAHSRLHVPHETAFLTDLMDSLPARSRLTEAQIDQAVDTVASHWRWKEWGLSADALRAAVDALTEPALGDVINAIYGLSLARVEKPRWGDKSPAYVTEIQRLHEVLPDAQFIHLLRDGRDVALSIAAKGWHGGSTRSIARYWAESNVEATAQGRKLPPDQYLRVDYEDLVLDTETTLRTVCSFLKEPFDPDMLTFFERSDERMPRPDLNRKTQRAPRATDVGRWRSEMHPLQVAVFEAFAGDVMDQMGQERRYRADLRPLKHACNAVEWFAEASLPLRRRMGLHFPKLRKKM